jgi:MoxR-like ATPase
MFKVVVDYPSENEEVAVVYRTLTGMPEIEQVLSPERLVQAQQATQEVFVDRAVNEYAVALVAATRDPGKYGLDEISPYIEFGASPRGSINLIHGGRALALLRGRGFVLPDDVRALALDVLRHRLVLTYEALAEDVDADALLGRVIAAVPIPEVTLSRSEVA